MNETLVWHHGILCPQNYRSLECQSICVQVANYRSTQHPLLLPAPEWAQVGSFQKECINQQWSTLSTMTIPLRCRRVIIVVQFADSGARLINLIASGKAFPSWIPRFFLLQTGHIVQLTGWEMD